MDVICVLPARLSSTRIPRKLLSNIAGRSLIEWSWRAARRIEAFDRIIIATDAEEIEDAARGFDAEVLMTRDDHVSGTDRVEEAAGRLGVADDDVIVNLQADEPFVDGPTVGAAVTALAADTEIEISTLAAPIRDDDEWNSPGVVKVVRAADGRALYFSRSRVPHTRDRQPNFDGTDERYLRHVGVYACRREALRRWASLPESGLERTERLEQLRALEAGMRIHVEVGPPTEAGVDLPEDIGRAERMLTEAGW
jgi:3-deoxy-manno-octulosonate cytidylyltransferase (CMP-KDO synthetase)